MMKPFGIRIGICKTDLLKDDVCPSLLKHPFFTANWQLAILCAMCFVCGIAFGIAI